MKITFTLSKLHIAQNCNSSVDKKIKSYQRKGLMLKGDVIDFHILLICFCLYQMIE